MKRIILFLSILQILYCNQAKEVNIDASQSLVGLGLDLTLSEQLSPTPDIGPEFLAVGLSCSLWTSEDGVEWAADAGSSVFPDCSGGSLYSVTYGNGLYVVVGTLTGKFDSRTDNCGLWTSPDGATWTRIPCPNNSGFPSEGNLPLRSISYGRVGGVKKFVAAGPKFGSDSIANQLYMIQSTNGKTWTAMEDIPETEHGTANGSCLVMFHNDTLYCAQEGGSYSAILEYNPSTSTSDMPGFPPSGGGNALESLTYAPPNVNVYDQYSFQFFVSRANSLLVFGMRESDSIAVSSKMNTSGVWPASVAIGFGANNRPNGFASDESGNIYSFANSCKWAYSSNQGISWTTINTLDACGTTSAYQDWMSATYSTKLNRMVVVGDAGSIGTTDISPTLTTDWTYLKVAGVSLQITSVTSKSK
ncbi:hypothetical protein EHQ52_04595 [Leptospira koniambonensis]|uniref:Exo-alpha-sialidase n=1 Tax=Leptospira koniambonensis TaxID=2484950 RepID=A0A4R9J572_9LEPT|nr:hypothetical protein [Leptospira koniambonensis]TGL33816.1 hypothetical protein EHQ52_04595 [Leptospira koniambonensis]